jgi:hypothetical protein
MIVEITSRLKKYIDLVQHNKQDFSKFLGIENEIKEITKICFSDEKVFMTVIYHNIGIDVLVVDIQTFEDWVIKLDF